MKYYWLVHFNYKKIGCGLTDASRLFLIKNYFIKTMFFDMIPNFDELFDFIQSEISSDKITINSVSIVRSKK